MLFIYICINPRTYKHTDDFVGIFKNRTPQLLALNPELVKRIHVQDFKHFHDNESVLMVSSIKFFQHDSLNYNYYII